MTRLLPTKELWRAADRVNRELSTHWETVRLGEIANILNGYAFKSKHFNTKKGIPIIIIRDIEKEKTEALYDGAYDPEYLIHSGDILIGMDGDFRCAEWKGPKGVLNQRVCKITLNENFYDRKLFLYGINRYLKAIQNATSFLTVTHLSSSTIADIPFPLPPLEEQKRIVKKIEELFEESKTVHQTIDKMPEIIRKFKQSVLNAAYHGELTIDWRKQNSVEASTVLLKKIIKERKENYEKLLAKSKQEKTRKPKKDFEISVIGTNPKIPTWVDVKLDNLVYIAARIGWRGLKAEEYTKSGPLLLSVYNLNNGEYVDFTKINHISMERYNESPEIQLKTNDILLAKDGAGIGKIGIIKNLPETATVNSSLLVIRSREAFIPKYLFYFLSGPQMQAIVKTKITGSATPHLFQRDIKEFTLSVPPLDEQKEIVQKIVKYFELADHIANSVNSARISSEKIDQSILSKAFRGDLVNLNADDESASNLLDKIKKFNDEEIPKLAHRQKRKRKTLSRI